MQNVWPCSIAIGLGTRPFCAQATLAYLRFRTAKKFQCAKEKLDEGLGLLCSSELYETLPTDGGIDFPNR